jgi:hypothetical protein
MAAKNISDFEVCLAVGWYQKDNSKFADEHLMEYSEEPQKVCLRALERAHKRGLIDYGVSLRSAWLTDKGRALRFDRLTAPGLFAVPRDRKL